MVHQACDYRVERNYIFAKIKEKRKEKEGIGGPWEVEMEGGQYNHLPSIVALQYVKPVIFVVVKNKFCQLQSQNKNQIVLF